MPAKSDVVVCPECIDEGHGRYRPPAKGATRGRCTTHWRAVKKARKQRTREQRGARVYGLTPEEQRAILEAQGGVCFICGRPSRVRALAWDHDHEHCEICAGSESCGSEDSIRGALCRICNYELLGHYNAVQLARAILYITRPPAKEILRALRSRQD